MNPSCYDTHAHLDHPRFAADLEEVLARAAAAGVTRLIGVGTDRASSERALALSERYPQVFAVVGWHPSDVATAPSDLRPWLRELARHPKAVALGETGLDYYWLPSREAGAPAPEADAQHQARQADCFRQHLEVAAELGLNVVVHQRDALEDTLRVFAPFADRVRAMFHCFTNDAEALRRVMALGSFVSFTGVLTFKNAEVVRRALAAAPLDRFMLETDCPYLAPLPHRGQRCEPAFVIETARVAAQVRGLSLEDLSAATCATAHRFFPRLGATA